MKSILLLIIATGCVVSPLSAAAQTPGGLEVPMDDSLLMRMLNRVAHLNKQFQPRARSQGVLVAEIRDSDAFDEFHYEVRPAVFGRARVEDVSDVRMIHQRKGLSFGFKTCDHAFRVHARLNQFEGNTPVDRFLLFRDENRV